MHYLLLSRYSLFFPSRLSVDHAIHFPPSSNESEKFSKRRRKLSQARTIDHWVLKAIFAINMNSAASFLRHSEAYKKHGIMLCEIHMNHHLCDEVENLSLHLYASREISIF